MALSFEQFQELYDKGLEADQIAAFEKLAAPEIEQEELTLGKVANAINNVYDRYKELPVIKQARQGVGLVTGVAGGLIGGATAAIGQPLANIFQGKPITEELVPAIKKQTTETARFGQMIGEEGTAAAPLGALPRIVTAPLAGAQIVKGVEETKEGIKTGDVERAISGGLSTATGLVSGTAAIRGRVPVVKEIKGALGARKIQQPPKLIQEATDIYRQILRPEKTEVKKIEIGKGKKIDDVFRFMAEEEISIGKDVNNKLDTVDARRTLIEKMDDPANQLNERLVSQPDKKFNLRNIESKAKNVIDNIKLSALEKKSRKADIEEIIDAEVEMRGEIVNGITLNEIKQGLWKMGFNQQKPTAHKTARIIGHEAKTAIEESYEDAPIRQLNERIGSLAEAISVLENAHGRVVQGGVIGQRLAGITGAIIGNTVNIPIIGPAIGHIAGTKLFEWLKSPERLSGSAIKKIQRAKSLINEK